MSAQFKMLRLQACLSGEALQTIKGLGYSEVAFEAPKSMLLRKYGGNRQEIQCDVDELIKMKPIREKNAKDLEKLSDMLERAVINLKENNRTADLESGTLYVHFYPWKTAAEIIVPIRSLGKRKQNRVVSNYAQELDCRRG